MKVFISWSGERSHRVAQVLRDWLPSVIPHVVPWVSSEDIDKGARWVLELGKELEAAVFGIICVVPGNLREPWINFEAGVMSKSLESSRVAPFLVGVDRSDVQGPLAQFQMTVLEKEDVRKLVHSMNRASATPVPSDRLDRSFDLCWPGLAKELEPLSAREEPKPTPAPAESTAEGLPAEQTTILTLMAKNPEYYPNASEIARTIGVNQTRTQYHLDRLMDHGLINDLVSVGEPRTYYLTEDGRAHAVENDLV